MLTREGRLAELAHAEAKQKHPRGYSKRQLVECAQQVFGGRGARLYLPVVKSEDIMNQRNAMALVDGRYPLSMDDCEVVGLSGGCGPTCSVLKEGRCSAPEGMEQST